MLRLTCDRCLHHLRGWHMLRHTSYHGHSHLTQLVEVVRQISSTHHVVGCLGTRIQQIHLRFLPGCVGFTVDLVCHRHRTFILLINDAKLVIGMWELRCMDYLSPRCSHLRRRCHVYWRGVHLLYDGHLVIVPGHGLSTVQGLGDGHWLVHLRHQRCFNPCWNGCINSC